MTYGENILKAQENNWHKLKAMEVLMEKGEHVDLDYQSKIELQFEILDQKLNES